MHIDEMQLQKGMWDAILDGIYGVCKIEKLKHTIFRKIVKTNLHRKYFSFGHPGSFRGVL